MDPNAKPPKVFISYSWTSEEHRQRVINIARQLAHDGIHPIIDEWDLQAGQDIYAFMEKMVTDQSVDFVLLMCDPAYAAKADARHGGVGTEAQIVSSEVYKKADQTKFIPIVLDRASDGSDPLPAYLKSRLYFDLTTEKFATGYASLLRTLLKMPASTRPAIGRPPAYLTDHDAASAATHLLRPSSKVARGGLAGPEASPRRLARSVIMDLKAQQILSRPSEDIDTYIESKIRGLKGLRDVGVEWIYDSLSQSNDTDIVNEFVMFLENAGSLCNQPTSQGVWNPMWEDHLRFYVREIFLYMTAVLIDERRWTLLRALLTSRFCITRWGELKVESYGVFDCYLRSLEEVANAKRERKRISMLADYVRERADHPVITFDMLMQADFLLCLIPLLGRHDRIAAPWMPRTLVYAEMRSSALPVFVRWTAGQFNSGFQELLGVDGPRGLYEALKAVGKSGLDRYRFDWTPIDFVELANLRQYHAEDKAGGWYTRGWH